jgi:hypothetical protein
VNVSIITAARPASAMAATPPRVRIIPNALQFLIAGLCFDMFRRG